jgi:hypothetical protein
MATSLKQPDRCEQFNDKGSFYVKLSKNLD